MKRGTIWKIVVITTAESEDAVCELLSTTFSEPVSSYVDTETGIASVAVYCEKLSPDFDLKCASLKTGILRIKKCGLDVGAATVSVKKIQRKDWAEAWKRHFKPIEIGDSLIVKPSWSKRRPKAGQIVITLDPGLSFGTGHHPTTSFCLRELIRRRNTRRQSFLDVGTGSGILAIAAAKFGYSTVHAFDFDAEAVRVALGNARSNRVFHKLNIINGDITKPPAKFQRKYDLVCANLISTLLIAERRRIVRLVKPTGALVLAGILKSEFVSVQTAYEESGLQLANSKSEKEWRSGTFVRRTKRTDG